MAELQRVMHYAKIRQKGGLTETDIAEFMDEVRAIAILTEDLYEVNRIEADVTDNMFLACALEGQADCIVSEDEHLRNLKYYHGTQIIGLEQLMKLLELRKPKDKRWLSHDAI